MSDEQSNPSQSDNPTCRCGHVEGSHRSGIRNCTWPGCDCQTFSGGTPSAEKAKGVAGWTQAQCAPYGGIEILPVAKEPPLNPSLESLARETADAFCCKLFIGFTSRCELLDLILSALEKATAAAREEMKGMLDVETKNRLAAVKSMQNAHVAIRNLVEVNDQVIVARDAARQEVERLKGELSRAVEFAAKCERGELRHDENLRKQFEKILKLGLVKRLDEDLSDCIARELARLTRIAGDWNEDNLPPSPEEWRVVKEEANSRRELMQSTTPLFNQSQKELAELRAQLSEAATKYGALTTEFVAAREERDKFWNSLLEHKDLCRRKLDEITQQRDELAAQFEALRSALEAACSEAYNAVPVDDSEDILAMECEWMEDGFKALALTPADALREHDRALAERAAEYVAALKECAEALRKICSEHRGGDKYNAAMRQAVSVLPPCPCKACEALRKLDAANV